MNAASLSIDLNGDVGEWDSTAADAATRFQADADLALSLSSLNVACGGHAGDPAQRGTTEDGCGQIVGDLLGRQRRQRGDVTHGLLRGGLKQKLRQRGRRAC